MKTHLKRRAGLRSNLLLLPLIALLIFFTSCKKGHEKPTVKVTTVASGLVNPMGIEADKSGNIWVTETGTANNDGKIIIIKPNGTKYDAVINLSSIINEASGEPEGPAHLIVDKGFLYVVAGNYLYKIDVSGFRPGDAPIDASTLPFEDIGHFSLSYPYVNNAHDAHEYGIAKGPDGDIYIADAGANAIIHRKGPGNYSVLAEVPGVANPTPVGPPQVQSVPTSLFFNGHDFLVTTLLGFPFPAGQAVIYKISLSGNVSVFQQGFTTLVDIAEGTWRGHLVLQYGTFGATGFNANTGALMWANGSSATELTGSLNMPVALKQVNDYTWYVTSMGDGTVLKVVYN